MVEPSHPLPPVMTRVSFLLPSVPSSPSEAVDALEEIEELKELDLRLPVVVAAIDIGYGYGYGTLCNASGNYKL